MQRVDHSEAGLYLWVTRDEDCWTTIDWLAGLGIVGAPGTFYGPAGERHVRLALHRHGRADRHRRGAPGRLRMGRGGHRSTGRVTWHIPRVTSTAVDEQHLRDLARLRRVRDRIDREYAQPLDVEALARGAHMSAGHLSRRFKLAYQDPPTPT